MKEQIRSAKISAVKFLPDGGVSKDVVDVVFHWDGINHGWDIEMVRTVGHTVSVYEDFITNPEQWVKNLVDILSRRRGYYLTVKVKRS